MNAPTEKKRGCFFYGCLFSLVGTGLLIAMFVGIFMYGKSVVGPVTDNFLQHVDKNEYTEAYAMLGDGWKKQMDQTQFTTFEKSIQNTLGTCQSKTMMGVFMSTVNGASTATAVYTAQFTKGAATLTFNLNKEGREWKVQGLQYQSPLLTGQTTPATSAGTPAPTTKPGTPASGVGSGATDTSVKTDDKKKDDKADQGAKEDDDDAGKPSEKSND
jgi:hypothetical protein